ncbi:MAG TPA: hypothetical protein VE422_35425 [Terriglobia bacterium]|nr:hypothetical protein [Terriglobia bacterium]
MKFNVGDRVEWVRAIPSPELKDIAGIVMAVIPNDQDLDDFYMYDIQFDFGLYTLYGTQLGPAKPTL